MSNLGLIRTSPKSNSFLRTVVANRSHGFPCFLNDSLRHFFTESETQNSPADSFPDSVYARVSGITKYTLKSDVIRLLEGCNLSLDDVKVEYNPSFTPTSMYFLLLPICDVQFSLPQFYNQANRINELKELHHLHGKLDISRIENFASATEALEANLKAKECLTELSLGWNADAAAEAESSQKEREVPALWPHTNLRSLKIEYYRSTTFLDCIQRCQQTVVLLPIAEQTVTALPSLEAIFVSACPALESLLEWGDDSKVKEVYVWRSKKLFEDRENWNLQRLSSLEFLNISGWDDTTFPDEGLLPTSFGKILIQGCSNLEAFNGKAFQQLTSLVKLSIIGCEKLRCLPEEGLPSSRSYLSIQRCPLLKQRCQEGGEDRPEVVHITSLYIPDN
ncbi:hypothetical protein TIFTF001_022885 [Ficus carica]|uniref:R13L1/DRL21-like LRR repeat region domain-containing protein n=1 Tax=Ficus carica TaxID=3494 RepID=A0AA88AWB1_FICCA|nr:hypothetical protein TIFTF001_022885 [Ficus carica]